MSNTKNKQITYTEKDVAIYDALVSAPEVTTDEGTFSGLTFRELKAVIPTLATGSVNSAVRKGIVEVVGGKTEQEVVKRKNAVYIIVDLSVEGKTDANGKALNYTDNEKAILAALANMKPEGNEFTLKDLSTFMGKTLTSGNINALVNKKGNLAKTDKVAIYEVTQDKKEPSNVYGLVEKLPDDFVEFANNKSR